MDTQEIVLTPLCDRSGEVIVRAGDFVRFRLPSGDLHDGHAVDVSDHFVIVKDAWGGRFAIEIDYEDVVEL